MEFTEEFFQTLEEFRISHGLNSENHPLYILLANSHQILDNQRDANKYFKIIDEYNARWKSVKVHEKLKEYHEQLLALIAAGQGMTDPEMLILLKAQIDIEAKITRILEA